MHGLAIHPQNYSSDISEDGDHINHETRNSSCSPSKRFVRFIVFIAVVGIAIICAIILPLVLQSAKNKDSQEWTTITTEKPTNTTYRTIQSTSNDHSINATTNKLSTTLAINHTDITSMTTSSTSNDYSFSTTNNKLSTASTINYTVSDQTVTTATVALTENLTTITTSEPKSTEHMTTSRPLIFLNYANDKIVGIHNTTAGGSNGGFNGIPGVPKVLRHFKKTVLFQE